MADTIQVPGKAIVSLGGSVLGETRNGVVYRSRPFFHDVHGDAHGGDEGPPIDRQFLGIIDDIVMHLVKFDKAIWLNALKKFSTAAAAGTVAAADIGKLYIGGGGVFSLSWTCASDSSFARTYAVAVPTSEPQEVNVGTVNAEVILSFEGWRHPTTGALWT